MIKFNESKAGKDAPESLKLFSFAITGDYLETDNPHRHIPQVIVDQMHELHTQSLKGTAQIIKKLERLIGQYPKIPALYNYLSVAYIAHGNTAKFDKLNEMLITQYPGYPVSRINQATRHILRSEFDKAETLLGNDITLNAFLPNRQVYHISEVVQFYETIVRLFIHKRQFDGADNHLKLLKDVSAKFDGFHKDKIKQLEEEKAQELEDMKYENYEKYSVEGIRKEWVAKSPSAPAFTHPEIEWLYEYGFDIPKEKIEALLALPRPTLIQDLHKVLDDAMARFDYFVEQAEDIIEDEERIQKMSFPAHAILLLAELKATTSLNYALNLMRQDDDWAHFWFDDMVSEVFPILFYKMMDDDLTVLKNYLLEPNNYSFHRMAIGTAITILAHHHPERRQECIDLFHEILNIFYDNRNDFQDIIDVELNASIVSDLIDLQSKDSFPIIEKLFTADLILDEMAGDLDEIREELFEIEDPYFHFNTIPTIFEDYKKIDAWYKPMSDEDHAAWTAKMEEAEKQLKEKEQKIADIKNQIAQLDKQPTLDLPKAGRNDPCPCGSGKKYKKCHGV